MVSAVYLVLGLACLHLRFYIFTISMVSASVFTVSIGSIRRSPIILLVTLLMVSPSPTRLAEQCKRYRSPGILIDSSAASLGVSFSSWREFEAYVYRLLPYRDDYLNWLTADYWPTVLEALGKGSEDCDGRAIVACSILQGMGYQAYVVVGLDHLWVMVRDGDSWIEILYPRPPAVMVFNESWSIHVGFWRELKLRIAPPVFYMDSLMVMAASIWLSTCLLIASPDAKRGLKAFGKGLLIYTPLTYLYSKAASLIPEASTILGLTAATIGLKLLWNSITR